MPATPRGPMADGKAAEEAKARPSPGTSRKVLLKRRASKINSAQFVSKAQCDDAMRVYEELRQLDPSDVAAHTGKGLACTDPATSNNWLSAEGIWDVIHFNFGLHDLKDSGRSLSFE